MALIVFILKMQFWHASSATTTYILPRPLYCNLQRSYRHPVNHQDTNKPRKASTKAQYYCQDRREFSFPVFFRRETEKWSYELGGFPFVSSKSKKVTKDSLFHSRSDINRRNNTYIQRYHWKLHS